MRGAEIQKGVATEQVMKGDIETTEIRLIGAAASADFDAHLPVKKVTSRKLRAESKACARCQLPNSYSKPVQLRTHQPVRKAASHPHEVVLRFWLRLGSQISLFHHASGVDFVC